MIFKKNFKYCFLSLRFYKVKLLRNVLHTYIRNDCLKINVLLKLFNALITESTMVKESIADNKRQLIFHHCVITSIMITKVTESFYSDSLHYAQILSLRIPYFTPMENHRSVLLVEFLFLFHFSLK